MAINWDDEQAPDGAAPGGTTWQDVAKRAQTSSRSAEERALEWRAWMIHAGVRQHERPAVACVLDELEDVHGYTRIRPALELVGIALGQAVLLRSDSIEGMGADRQILPASDFIGHLIEKYATIDASTRYFELTDWRLRMDYERVDLEDCLVAAAIARRLGILDMRAPRPVGLLAELAMAFRRRLLEHGYEHLQEITQSVKTVPESGRVKAFITATGLAIEAHRLRVRKSWQAFKDLYLEGAVEWP